MKAQYTFQLDWTISLVGTALLICLGKLLSTSLVIPVPSGIFLSLTAVSGLYCFGGVLSQDKWQSGFSVKTIAMMVLTCLILLGLSASIGSVAVSFAWASIVLAVGSLSIMASAVDAPPEIEVTPQANIATCPPEEESLESQLLNGLHEFAETEALDAEETLLQSWTRIRHLDGTERLEGSIRVIFEANQSLQNLHLPIYPAFNSLPQVWCEADAPNLTAEVETTQTYGVRVRVRRQGNHSSPLEVELCVVMSTQNSAIAEVA